MFPTVKRLGTMERLVRILARSRIRRLGRLPSISMKSFRSQWIHRGRGRPWRSEEHTSELQSRGHLVCRLLLEFYADHQALHSFPTRRSSDLQCRDDRVIAAENVSDGEKAGNNGKTCPDSRSISNTSSGPSPKHIYEILPITVDPPRTRAPL